MSVMGREWRNDGREAAWPLMDQMICKAPCSSPLTGLLEARAAHSLQAALGTHEPSLYCRSGKGSSPETKLPRGVTFLLG